ncbi:hypothetical protein SAMN05660659_01106 [Pseudomonas sp. LAMO17WK12:I6]|nr:hypothetical protein SAMN05660659_01106 [Pseudomonas sp. LAMO17WK12:I6]SNY19043.1 hypothetical protein SAMN05660455_01599 [Pseudomonas sp. LAMO17WK12:I5]
MMTAYSLKALYPQLQQNHQIQMNWIHLHYTNIKKTT